MLSIRHAGDDPAAPQAAYDGFRYWGNIRAACQVGAFAANIWALVALLRCTS